MKALPQQKFPAAVAARLARESQQEPNPANGDREANAERRLSLLLEVAHIIPWEADFASSRFTYVGEQAEEVLGYSVAEWYTPDFWSSALAS
jgi:PAS domain-containing protein